MTERIYQLSAKILSYPGSETLQAAKELEAELVKIDSSYHEVLLPFIEFLSKQERGAMEEAYTNTFDVQAVCPLEVGYTLFGEDYKRGEFLVRMSDLHAEHKTLLNQSELADYLPNVLMLLKEMQESEFKKEFIEKILLPSLSKMLKNFEAGKGANPYARPIMALNSMLSRQYKMNPTILEVTYE
ncbi:MAG: nitrate reductase molybdenum cofactor assembly chaperone [Bacteriovoracaceae bacterium]